ncbi:hypothetical protein SAMN05421780_10522 [Flexibacter flexilis DSM 6793]|uniref:Uncharacterized protein n=1 Tax=Flexibacter flexilis DSM 6793 TaxID=927664 RepID=A0A1I1INB1_9BACT|nr:hypothetical protein [Flexibacter flexilis]SFC37421.1 hypothetical protein SAMN05421780_10522 [Flexibacter flexilis DSM 6793]
MKLHYVFRLIGLFLIVCSLWSCGSKPRYYVFRTVRHNPTAKAPKALAAADTLSLPENILQEKIATNQGFMRQDAKFRAKQLRKVNRRLKVAKRLVRLMPAAQKTQLQAQLVLALQAQQAQLQDSTQVIMPASSKPCFTCILCDPIKNYNSVREWVKSSRPRYTTNRRGFAGCMSSLVNLITAIAYPFILIIAGVMMVALLAEMLAILGLLTLVGFGVLYGLLSLLGVSSVLVVPLSVGLSVPLALVFYSLFCFFD